MIWRKAEWALLIALLLLLAANGNGPRVTIIPDDEKPKVGP